MEPATRYCAACLTTFLGDPEGCTNLTCGERRPAAGWGVLLGPGDLLDRRYVIERVLAVGGAGLTYLARETDAEVQPRGPQLAIKVLYAARDTGEFLRRLSNEAQILQELSHPHIVDCLGFVHRSGQEPYLVTRYEAGGSLQKHVERVGPLPVQVAVAVVRQVLLALEVAHQRGVIHRDLKPDNVLLDRLCARDDVPHVRVADFGIAKVRGGVAGRVTKVGSFVGTPEYAAPEQFEGGVPSAATDVFAVGGLLWFLLTGQPPVALTQRHDLDTTYAEVVKQVPPPWDASLRADVTPSEVRLLQRLFDAMMAVQPGVRWSIQRVLHGLLPLGGELPSGASSTLDVTDPAAPERAVRPSPVEAMPAEARPTLPERPPPARSSVEETAWVPRDDLPDHERRTGDAARGVDGRSEASPEPVDPGTGPARAAHAVGCLGLSFVSVGGAATVGAVAVVGVWLASAWGFGWFQPPTVTDEVVLRGAPPQRWSGTPQLLGSGKRAAVRRRVIQRALDLQTPALGRLCHAQGRAVAELLYRPDGTIVYAMVDEGWLPESSRDCVERELAGRKLAPRIATESRVRVALTLD